MCTIFPMCKNYLGLTTTWKLIDNQYKIEHQGQNSASKWTYGEVLLSSNSGQLSVAKDKSDFEYKDSIL